jgi:ribosome-binding protein aMBF1 (putative translation factor)
MIHNEREYHITSTEAEKFARTIEQVEAECAASTLHPVLYQAQLDALRSQLSDLKEELEEYDALRRGEHATLSVESFDDLPNALIRARIARGLTQRELALRLGLKEQQVQRYEATRYASASLTRVGEVIHALGVEAPVEIHLPRETEPTPASA